MLIIDKTSLEKVNFYNGLIFIVDDYYYRMVIKNTENLFSVLDLEDKELIFTSKTFDELEGYYSNSKLRDVTKKAKLILE